MLANATPKTKTNTKVLEFGNIPYVKLKTIETWHSIVSTNTEFGEVMNASEPVVPKKGASPARVYRKRPNVLAADFYSALATRNWNEQRTTMAFRRLVLGHKTGDIAAELGVTKWNVSQAATTALGIIEAWRGEQVVRSAYEHDGVNGLIDGIESLAVRIAAMEAVMNRGPICIALRKSVESLRAAADILHPYAENAQ